MTKIIPVSCFLFILPLFCKSQTDTIYYDQNDHKTIRDKAEYYSIIHFEKENWYKVNMYFMNDTLKMRGHYSNIDSQTKEGLFSAYYKSGKLGGIGTYHNNKENGTWEYYYDTSGTLWYMCNYIGGQKNGKLTSFYKNGKLKRLEYHKFDSTLLSGKCFDKNNNKIVCSGDVVSEGKCYDEQGNDIIFTLFEIIPYAPYNFGKILKKNLRYPDSARENSIEGRVIVKFAIQKDGKITDVHAEKSVSPELDAEAIRVVSMFDPWVPGSRDDKPVIVYFNLPIVFKLH